jgi:glycosyltransferase involved in cell wall biosynthesis
MRHKDFKMKIRFYSDAYKGKRASHRLRGEVIADALSRQGYDSGVLRDWADVDKDTVVVFLKRSQPTSIQKAKDLGAKTIYDLCDNKFEEKEEYEPCCKIADLVSVNSVQMGVSTKHHTGRDSIVMPDPYERPRLPVSFSPRRFVKLLWFGSQSSFKFLPLVEIWQRLEKDIKDYRYTMISSKTDRLLNKMQYRQNRGIISGINFSKLDMREWTWELQGELLKECDIVLMPVQTENPRTDTKSANRVIDSIISGKFVITTPLASYLEFAPYTWQGDYIEGIQWALNNPDEVRKMIELGQKYTEENYSPEVISKKFIIEVCRQLGWSDGQS